MVTPKNGRLKKGMQVLLLTRGQVLAQEQKKMLREVVTAASKGGAQIPHTRGQVAAQEQMRIIGQYIDNMSAGASNSYYLCSMVGPAGKAIKTDTDRLKNKQDAEKALSFPKFPFLH